MNSTQIQSTLAPLVTFLAGLAAGKGLFGLDSATWATILGALAGLGATIWAAVATRGTAIISQAAASPEVQSIKLTQNASLETVNATPNNVTK
jgi:hypothetical protein